MSGIEVKVTGVPELRKKLDPEVTVQPALEDARDMLLKRVKDQGNGLGAQRNRLTVQSEPLGATVTSTLNQPRTKGTSWQQKNEDLARAMGPRVERVTAERIEQSWSGA